MLFDIVSLVAESRDFVFPLELLFLVESAAVQRLVNLRPFLLLHLLQYFVGLDGCTFFAALVPGSPKIGQFSCVCCHCS